MGLWRRPLQAVAALPRFLALPASLPPFVSHCLHMPPCWLQPTSMTVGHGYVAAGGQNSQLDVRQLAGGEIVYKVWRGGLPAAALHPGRPAWPRPAHPAAPPCLDQT